MNPVLFNSDNEKINLPIRVTLYNNYKEMISALPAKSKTVSRELVTEGQAFTSYGTVLVLGSGQLTSGTASHEATHILSHRAGEGRIYKLPQWLDEGLAEYGNIQPSYSYDLALEFAIGTNRLITPITLSQKYPSTPEDVIIFYGQSRSLVSIPCFQVPQVVVNFSAGSTDVPESSKIVPSIAGFTSWAVNVLCQRRSSLNTPSQ